MALSGAQRTAYQEAEVPPGQIDMLNSMSENPQYQHINLSENLLTNPELRELRTDMLSIFESEELLEAFAEQTRTDPSLMDKIDYLIENDPERLRTEILPAFRENPDGLDEALGQSVMDEQLVAHTAPAPQDESSPHALQQFMSQFTDMLEGFSLENISLENIGQMMLSMINGMHNMAMGFMGGLSNFAQNPEHIIVGNGGPGGPAAQAAEVAQARGVAFDQDGVHIDNDAQPGAAPAGTSDPAVDAVENDVARATSSQGPQVA